VINDNYPSMSWILIVAVHMKGDSPGWLANGKSCAPMAERMFAWRQFLFFSGGEKFYLPLFPAFVLFHSSIGPAYSRKQVPFHI
jgi:hypothetical protein